MTKLKKGDIIWVRTGLGSHEEPATILDPSCHYYGDRNDSDYDDDDDDDERMEEKKEGEWMNHPSDDQSKSSHSSDKKNEDGILVRYNVSLVESIVHCKNVRSLVSNDADNQGRRRSTRNKRSVIAYQNGSGCSDGTTSKQKETNVERNNDVDDIDTKTKKKKTTKKEENKKKKNNEESRRKKGADETNITMEITDNNGDFVTPTPPSKVESNLKSKKTTQMKRKRKAKEIESEVQDEDICEEEKSSSSSSSTLLEKNATTKNLETPSPQKKRKRNIEERKIGLKSSPYFDKNKANEEHDSDAKDSNQHKKKATRAKTSNSKIKTAKASKSTKKETSKKKEKETKKNELAGKSDGNGGLIPSNATYMIEYAKTGRSTCKRCDQQIKKGEIRVGHRPLFRGKPGFRIYKHLHCIVFSSSVHSYKDVDGYEELTRDDCIILEKRIGESMIEIQKENEALDPDELVQKAFDGEMRDRPKGLKANLLPFQKEGVSWMYCQEVNVPEIRGGILADEMGMGKTLQTITSMLDNRPKLQHCLPDAKHPPFCSEEMREKLVAEEKLWEKCLKEWNHEIKMNNVPASVLPKKKRNSRGGGGARAGTLVVCPVIALSQWKSEIEKFCEEQALTVCIYHGPDRAKNMPREVMMKYDVVLTTYQVIEQDFRKMISPNKVKCPNCGNKFKIDKLHVHLKYFCGEGAQRTEAQSRTRRNRDTQTNPQRGGNSSSRQGDKKKGTDRKKISKASTKKVFKVKGDEDYASESDLSIQTNYSSFKRKARSSRVAATKAKQRVSATAKSESKTKRHTDDSEEDYVESDEDYSDKDIGPTSIDSSSEDDVAIKRAKKQQAKAFEKAKKGKGSREGRKMEKKTFTKKGKESEAEKRNASKKKMKKGKLMKKKKGKDDNSSSGDSDFSSDTDDDTFDIDMEALIAEAMAGCQLSILHSFCWWRIVLDEAHFIKSRSSQTSAAAFALIGIHRWCLSGTPLQNRVGEFYSLVRFLRLDPMAHYLCRSKDCNCKQVHYRMQNGRCLDCGHSSIQHYSVFNRQILNPIQRDGYANDGRRAMFKLKNDVLDKCLLRRTKETRAEDMNLPPRIVTIKTIRLHPIEEDFYNAVFTKTTSSFNDYVAEGTLLNNYAHIFDLLMRMRQAVCHPYLVVHSKRDMALSASQNPIVTNGTIDCHLCNEPPTDRVVSTCCRTAFCKSCVLEYMEMSAGVGGENAISCPTCRNPFTIDLSQVQESVANDSTLSVSSKEKVSRIGLPSLQELPHVASGSILRRIDLTEFATSSKIEALTMELVNMRKNSPGSKAIVFSQFVNMLDLIRWRLHSDPCLAEMGLGVRALHGSMDVKSRDATLEDFRNNPNVRVLLMSLKAGGVALNLTVANYIYLMDPWWNPAAEMQAIDRTHRLGQYRPIRAVRFIAANTVEERILQLQEKKRLVFDGTVGRDAGSLKMLTVNDMKSLFA